MNENKFKKLFKLFYRHDNYIKVKGDNNIIIQNGNALIQENNVLIQENNVLIQKHKPKFTKVYSTYDLPVEPHSFLFWNVTYLEENQVGLLKKLYEHLSTAEEIVYLCEKCGVTCSVKTKKFGWCKLILNYSKMFTEFGIYRSQTRYDINYVYILEAYQPLYDFISDFVDKARKEYLEDRNL